MHAERHVEETDRIGVGEEARQRSRLPFPNVGGQAHGEDHESDRHHDPGRQRGASQTPDDPPFDERTDRRAEDDHYEDDCDPDGPTVLNRELPVQKGRQHADGTVSEVEDSRRCVGDDQSARRDGVGGSNRNTNNDELEDLFEVHRATARLQVWLDFAQGA